MKKKEIMLAAAILLAALLLWGILTLIKPSGGDTLRITVNNQLYGEYSLKEDQTIRIGQTNICEIKDGAVRMVKADCPDHLCMKSEAVTGEGGTIVCLPNRVILEVISSNSQAPDTVAS